MISFGSRNITDPLFYPLCKMKGLYSPSPEYPAACRSVAEIPPSGAAGMKGEVNRAEAHQSEGGLISLYHSNFGMATAQFRFDTPQLAAGSFIFYSFKYRQVSVDF